MTNIEKLLQKYNNNYVNGETRSKNYETQIKQQQRLKQRLIKLDLLLLETKTLLITPAQKKQIQYLICTHSNNFKKLHGNASEETIILAFIFYLKKTENPKIQIDRYTITKKYNLNHHTFETIICKLLKTTLEKTPIKPTPNKEDNHEILLKQGKTKQ